ncbi:hypothetical protein AQUCO_01500265v1 [Aquilegia coerulea]|uniref:Uncharacterized protein n=1 Tax=Aquilegia coerulea TaxID=218851 RepID=A0A2G5DT38_AQUCA|nr:hypothetical protein AQUCO_01500265v1 [Aquilegia coerulea]
MSIHFVPMLFNLVQCFVDKVLLLGKFLLFIKVFSSYFSCEIHSLFVLPWVHKTEAEVVSPVRFSLFKALLEYTRRFT